MTIATMMMMMWYLPVACQVTNICCSDRTGNGFVYSCQSHSCLAHDTRTRVPCEPFSWRNPCSLHSCSPHHIITVHRSTKNTAKLMIHKSLTNCDLKAANATAILELSSKKVVWITSILIPVSALKYLCLQHSPDLDGFGWTEKAGCDGKEKEVRKVAGKKLWPWQMLIWGRQKVIIDQWNNIMQ